MKLPKNFGGGSNFGDIMRKAQEAMQRAKTLEDELAAERIEVDKGVVKATFDGRGQIVGLKIAPEVVDPNDVEMLEDLIVSCLKDGFERATELRGKKVQEITPDIPGLPNLGL